MSHGILWFARLTRNLGGFTTGCMMLCFALSAAAQDPASITIHVDSPLGPVNRLVFGSNQVAYDPAIFGQPWNDVFSNYGAGLWNPNTRQIVPGAKTRAIDIGMTVSRFPGGLGAQQYDWKQAVGPIGQRPNWQFGPSEFLETCEEIDAIPVFTLSSFVGDAQDLADFVEYLNAVDDGTNPWAALRTQVGHPEPYGVVCFEFGNECYTDWSNGQELRDMQEYAQRFNAASQAMKAVDPTVKLGVVLTNDAPGTVWNESVLTDVAGHADFVVVHVYLPLYDSDVSPAGPVSELFANALAAPAQLERMLAQYRTLITQTTGRNDLPIAVTEFNGLFLGDDPVPYRFCLGNALLNAEFLRVFLRPENGVILANHWLFLNEYWGQVKGPEKGENVPYVDRPNCHPFALYNHHFGTTLLDTTVACDTYETDGGHGVLPSQGAGGTLTYLSNDLIDGTNWTIWPVDGVQATQENQVLSFVFSPSGDTYSSTLMEVTQGVSPGKTYRLSVEVLFSRSGTGVQLYLGDSRGWAATQSGTLSDPAWVWKDRWCTMHTDYTTLPDATGLQLVVYRAPNDVGDSVQVRNWTVREITPEFLPATPWLSVTASAGKKGSPDPLGERVYLMVVNKDQQGPRTATVAVPGFDAKSTRAWVLDGPSIDATNEVDPATVHVSAQPVNTAKDGLTFTFGPHSLTAIEIYDYIDSDVDGLTNETETALGTNPYNADSDGDGLSDGDEVNTHSTNPKIPDTDGDGYNDGQEVQMGTDPHDPNSPRVPGGCQGASAASNATPFSGQTPSRNSVRFLLDPVVVAVILALFARTRRRHLER